MITFGPTIQQPAPTQEVVVASRDSMARIVALFNADQEATDSDIRIEEDPQ